MIVFDINHTDNKTLLQRMATAAGMPYHGEDFIKLKPPIGHGLIKIINITDELQVLMADASFFQNLLAKREYSEKRFYILHFDDLFVKNNATFIVDGEVLNKTKTRHSVVRLTSNIFSNTEEISANTPFKTVKIFFSEGWLKNYMGLAADTDFLQKYIALKTASFDIEPLDAEYLKLLDELWKVDKDNPLQNLILKNRVTLLIERFFLRLINKINLQEGKYDLSSEDIKLLLQVEHLLVKDFTNQPPTIDEMAKIVSMSTTKLKKSFKKMYGDSIYSYYQKRRLQKAHELLLTGKFSIKQASVAVGFNNISNFVLAYKKQFSQLPDERFKN